MIWLILFACLSLSWLLRDTKNVAWTLQLHIPNSMRWIRALMTPFYWCMKMNWAHMALIHKLLHTMCLLQQSQKHVLNLEYFKNYAGVLSISKSLKWIPFSHAFEVAYLPFWCQILSVQWIQHPNQTFILDSAVYTLVFVDIWDTKIPTLSQQKRLVSDLQPSDWQLQSSQETTDHLKWH